MTTSETSSNFFNFKMASKHESSTIQSTKTLNPFSFLKIKTKLFRNPKSCPPNVFSNMIQEKNSTNSINSPATLDWKKVHSAIRWQKIDEVKGYLESGDGANLVDPTNGNYSIHIAAQNGHNDIVNYLITKGAIINSKNNKGNTALHMALSYDYYDTALILKENGADTNEKNDSGFASSFGIDGDKSFCVAALIKAGKSKNIANITQALDLCDENITDVNKASFASLGLKMKKELGESWKTELQQKFQSILNKLCA